LFFLAVMVLLVEGLYLEANAMFKLARQPGMEAFPDAHFDEQPRNSCSWKTFPSTWAYKRHMTLCVEKEVIQKYPREQKGGYVVMQGATYDGQTETLWNMQHRLEIRRSSCMERGRLPPWNKRHLDVVRDYENETVILLGPVRHSEGYYHFVLDSIQHLVQIPDDIIANPAVKLVVGYPFLYPKALKFLEEFGYGNVSRIEIPQPLWDKRFSFGKVYFPAGGACLLANKNRISALRERYMRTHKNARFDGNFTVIIDRTGAKKRTLPNGDVLVTALRRHFPDQLFRLHTASLYPKQSLELFRNAAVIVGPHGAGMVHAIVSRPGIKLVEISPTWGPKAPHCPCNPSYFSLACAAQLDYWLMSIPGHEDRFAAPVNITSFLQMMEHVYATPSPRPSP
jgi:hypothetical protein